MQTQGTGSAQTTQSIASCSDKTTVEWNSSSPTITLGHWIYIHRYPINTSGDDSAAKTAVLYSLSEGQKNLLERESRELKNIVNELQKDIDGALKNEDNKNEQVKTLKENAITALKTIGVMDSGAGKDAFGMDLAEYLLLEKQELCFARQSTLQTIIANNTDRLIEVRVPKSASDIKALFMSAINSFALKNEARFNVQCSGSLTEMYAPLDQWFKNLENALSGSTEGQTAFFAYEANISTVFLRYMANASGRAGFEAQPGKLHAYVTGDAKATVDLVRCQADANFYVPSRQGLALEIPPIPAEWQNKPTLKLADEFKKLPPAPLVCSDEERKRLSANFPYENSFPRVHFDFDSSFLKPAMLKSLVRLEKQLQQNPDYKVQIVGHTDLVGSDGYNMSLSERRARSVLAYIENDAGFWEGLYSELEPRMWGIPVLKTILLALLADKQTRMDAEQTALYQNLKTALPEKTHANEFTLNFQKGLALYFELYAYGSRYSALQETRALRLQMFSDYMRLHGDVLITRGRFHSSKLMFLGENNPDEKTSERSARNRRVEFWLYKAYNTDDNFAHLGFCRIHLCGTLQGWAGASAAAAIDLDAKIDASNQLRLIGTHRTAPADEQDAKPMRIAARRTDKTDIDSSSEVTFNDDAHQWGLTRESEQRAYSTERLEYAVANDQQLTQGVVERNQETKNTQSDTLYWDDENNALVREKKKETRTSDSIKWRQTTTRKINSVIPDELANAGAAANLSAFAGAKGEATGSIALEWASAEADSSGSTNVIQQNGQPVEVENDGFLELAKAGGGVEGWVGAGAEVDFAIRLGDQQILVRTKLAAAIGLGAGVAVDMQVAPINIYNMLMFMYDQLRKADYSFLPYIAQEAWQQIQYGLTKYLMNGVDGVRYAVNEGLEAGQLLIEQGVAIGKAIQQKIDEQTENIEEWWRDYSEKVDDVKQVCDNIKRNPHGLRIAPPDVKARLLTALLVEYQKLKEFSDQDGTGWFGGVSKAFERFRNDQDAYEHIEDSILCILQWVQSQDEFEKVMQQTGVGAPVRPKKDNIKFLDENLQFSQELFDQALSDYEQQKPINVKRQTQVLHNLFDGHQEMLFDIWRTQHLPQKAQQNGLL